jgi:hypothetical protein
LSTKSSGLVIDGEVRAVLEAAPAFFIGTRRDDHADAGELAQRRCRGADAASSAVNQCRFALAHACEEEEIQEGR